MKKFLSLVLALVMAMSLVTVSASAADFTDEASIDPIYAEAVDVISALGIVSGNNGAFMPQDNLTRGAAAKILAGVKLGADLAAKLPKTSAFTDVPAGSTFAGYISYLKDEGIVGGYGNGTFGPSNKLTGDAFLKQVLGVLGYKADVEGYNVTGWQVAVAIDALSAGLLNGLENFNSAALITREQAAQIILNALQANMVEYKSQSSITIGDVVINNTSEATVVENTGAHFKGGEADGKMQLVEKAFPKVTKVENTYDAFMRPATQWKNDGKEIALYIPAADVTYTVAQYRNTVYNALGLTDEAVKYIRYDNGTTAAAKTEAAFTATNGKYTAELMANDGTNYVDSSAYRSGWEIYYRADVTDAPKVSVIRIDEYIAKVKTVNAASGAVKRSVTLETVGSAFPVQGTVDFTTDEFEKGDIVTFTYSKKTNAVVDVKLAEYKTGEVTKYQLNSGRYDIFVDDFRINYAWPAAGASASTQLTVGDTVKVYLDRNGYYLWSEKVTEVNKYAYVLDAKNDTSALFGDAVAYAQLLFTDGTVEVVETAELYTDAINDFVTYTINNDGEYVLEDADTTNIAAKANAATTKGAVTVKVNGANVAVNNATTFIIKTVKDGKDVYTVYVGYKTIPTITQGSTFSDCIVEENAKAAAFVYIDAEGLTVDTGAGKEDVIIVNRHTTGPTKYTDNNGSWYQFNVVVDGAVKEIKLDTASYATLDRRVVLFTEYTINEDGYYVLDAADRITPSAYYQASAKCGIDYVDGLLILGITDGTQAANYALDEDVTIVYCSGSTTTIWTEADLTEDANDYAWPYDTDSDGDVDYLFIEKK